MTSGNFSLQFATRKEPQTMKITTLLFGRNHEANQRKWCQTDIPKIKIEDEVL